MIVLCVRANWFVLLRLLAASSSITNGATQRNTSATPLWFGGLGPVCTAVNMVEATMPAAADRPSPSGARFERKTRVQTGTKNLRVGFPNPDRLT